jgi:hypothetical protein
LPPEAAVADRREQPRQEGHHDCNDLARAVDERSRRLVGHAPHPWDRGTRFPGESEPRQAARVVATQDRVRSEPNDDPSNIVELSREPRTWFKVSFGTAALLGAMLLVMWAQHAPTMCAVSFEAPRRLQLNRQVDREHLAADAASAVRAARRYTWGTAGKEQQRRFVECEDLLVSEIAARHGVSVDQVRAATGYAE